MQRQILIIAITVLALFSLSLTVLAKVTSATPATIGSLAGSPCPASVHDKYVVAGPDGKMYPTWHPPG